MKYLIFKYKEGQDISLLTKILNNGWYINQTNNSGNTIVYILCKSE